MSDGFGRFWSSKRICSGNQRLIFPFAFTYRDYVVDAFNGDKPFNQFVKEQLAADLLGLAGYTATPADAADYRKQRQAIDKKIAAAAGKTAQGWAVKHSDLTFIREGFTSCVFVPCLAS